jgi:uncharacterized OsmC-like protein
MTTEPTSTVHDVQGQPIGAAAADITKEPDLPKAMRGRSFTMSADMETLKMDRQLKVGRFRDFEFYCDEPHYLGGDDEYPQPLTYLAAGVGFCLLTQVQRVASMLRKTFTRAECRCEFDTYQDGSARAGTLSATVTEFRIHLVIRLATNSCFAEALVREPIPLRHIVTVNGAPFPVEEAPTR